MKPALTFTKHGLPIIAGCVTTAIAYYLALEVLVASYDFLCSQQLFTQPVAGSPVTVGLCFYFICWQILFRYWLTPWNFGRYHSEALVEFWTDYRSRRREKTEENTQFITELRKSQVEA